VLWHGAKIGVFGGDILKIKDDLAILKPTIFATVPRLFLRMYDTIN
jgi:long-chain acyl-CoA synthetase